jgi:ferric-dicitrate binding protein FerR (iron transport regulator)
MVFAPAAAVAAVLLIGAWGLWQTSDVPLPNQGADSQPVIAAVPKPAPPKVAARLATSFDAKWLDPAAMVLGQDVLEGSRLTLLSGVVQLDMVGGAAVVIEGPTDLELTGPDALRLKQGKTAVRIADGGQSFVVDTPTMQVIDLGTEFGVETAASGDEQVMVFDGSVR